MPQQPIIGLDVDGVVADLVSHLFNQLEKRSGSRLDPHQVRQFDLRKTLGHLWPLGEQILAQQGFVSSLKPYPGALRGIECLRKLGRVVFVTTPNPKSPTWADERACWLEKLAHAHRRDIVHAVDKTLFGGSLLIDDAPAQLQAWIDSGRPAIRVVRPWNHGAPGHCAQNWDQIVSISRRLLNLDGTAPQHHPR